MPEIIVHAFEGRSLEQKRQLVKEVTEAVCRSFAVPPEAVSIRIVENSRENQAKAGLLWCDRDTARS